MSMTVPPLVSSHRTPLPSWGVTVVMTSQWVELRVKTLLMEMLMWAGPEVVRRGLTVVQVILK